MLESLRSWCTVDIELLQYLGRSGSGDATYDASTTIKGYAEGGAVAITDKYGKEYVSLARFYLPEDVEITINDKIIQYDKECEIRRIAEYFDGNTGQLDMRVVYL